MKKLTIGRNNVCDVIIPDTTDLVSRKQAILTFSFWGKMVLYDTSNNGTYVNGKKLENGKGCRVTRKDKINFARIADLDWNEIHDPYRKLKIIYLVSISLLIVAALLLAFWLSQPKKEDSQTIEKTEQQPEKGETVTTVEQPSFFEQPEQKPAQKSPKKVSSKKKKTKTSNEKKEDVKQNEVNDHSPIVY